MKGKTMHAEIEQIKKAINGLWAKSLAFVLALVLGFLAGKLTTQWDVMDDCKYISSFRISTQAFACQRRM